MSMQKPSGPVTLFYSYAHEDEPLRDKLNRHLSILQHEKYLSTWSARDVRAGDDRITEINTRLESAQIILLLISSDFLASNYHYSVEMQRALERHRRREVKVIPILLRPCDWSAVAPFAKLQVLPTNRKPITLWENIDAAWTDVAREIRIALKDLSPAGEEDGSALLGEPPFPVKSPSPSRKRLKGRVIFSGMILLLLFVLSMLLLKSIPSSAGGTPATNVTATRSIPSSTGQTSATSATATPQGTATPGGLSYTVKNTDETPPDGVYFRHSLQSNPNTPTPTPTLNFGVFMGERVLVTCWALDADVYGTDVWYYAYNITRPMVAGRSNKGWLSAHYVDDGMAANHPAPGIPPCGNPLPIGG